MTKPHAGAELDESGLNRGRCSLGPDPEPLGCSPEQRRLAHRIRRRELQQAPCLGRKTIEPAPEGPLDPP